MDLLILRAFSGLPFNMHVFFKLQLKFYQKFEKFSSFSKSAISRFPPEKTRWSHGLLNWQLMICNKFSRKWDGIHMVIPIFYLSKFSSFHKLIYYSLDPVRAIRVNGGGGLEPSTSPIFQVPCFRHEWPIQLISTPLKVPTHPMKGWSHHRGFKTSHHSVALGWNWSIDHVKNSIKSR